MCIRDRYWADAIRVSPAHPGWARVRTTTSVASSSREIYHFAVFCEILVA